MYRIRKKKAKIFFSIFWAHKFVWAGWSTMGPIGPERCPIWVKIAKIAFFGLLIEFESFDLTANDLKQFLLWSNTIPIMM